MTKPNETPKKPAPEGAVYQPGTPTARWVDALLDHFGAPYTGQVIPYREIAYAVGLPEIFDLPKSPSAIPEHFRRRMRYATIVAAWRHRLEDEHNCYLVIDRLGKSYVVANAPKRLTRAQRHTAAGIRKLRRAATCLSGTTREDLPPVAQAEYDHLQRRQAMLIAAAAAANRKDGNEVHVPRVGQRALKGHEND